MTMQCNPTSCYFGTCSNNTCICPSEYRIDDFFFLQPNSCTFPRQLYFFLCIEGAVVSFLHLIFLLNLARKHASTASRYLILKAGIANLFSFFCSLAIYLEDGPKEVTVLIVSVFIMSLIILGRGLVVFILSPIMVFVNVKNRLFVTEVGSIFSNISLGIIAITWASYVRRDLESLNIVVCLFYATSASTSILLVTIIHFVTTILRKEVQQMLDLTSVSSENRQETTTKLLIKLRNFHKLVLIFCVINASALAIQPLVFVSLGFFPFAWVMGVVSFHACFIPIWATAILLKKQAPIKSDSQPPTDSLRVQPKSSMKVISAHNY